MTESVRSIEQLNNEIVHLRKENRTLAAELAFHRRIFREFKQALGAVIHIESSNNEDEAIRQLLQENAELKNKIKIARLSEREREVFRLIAKGLTSRKIAEQLSISKLTVDTHRKHIQSKLNVTNMAELIKIAVVLRTE